MQGIQALVSPANSFVIEIRVGKYQDQTSAVLRNLKHYLVIFGFIKQESLRRDFPEVTTQKTGFIALLQLTPCPRPWTQS